MKKIISDVEENARKRAKELRYKKPAVLEISMEFIPDQLYEMGSALYDVQYAWEGEADELLGEEEAKEFKIMCSQLEYDINRLEQDLRDEWVPDNFDDCMAAMCHDVPGFHILGFDSYEGDYFGINGCENYAAEEAAKRLKRLTKDQLIQVFHQCTAIALQYMGIRHRYNMLEASIEVLRDENRGLHELITKIDEAHDKAYGIEAMKECRVWGDWKRSKERSDFDELLAQIDPYSRIWIE